MLFLILFLFCFAVVNSNSNVLLPPFCKGKQQHDFYKSSSIGILFCYFNNENYKIFQLEGAKTIKINQLLIKLLV